MGILCGLLCGIDAGVVAGGLPYLRAAEVIAGMGCSRRLAELRFREMVGRSILEEIRRVRIETACAALSDTEKSLSSVANSCGWASIPTFCLDFKRATGLTPEGWRRKSR